MIQQTGPHSNAQDIIQELQSNGFFSLSSQQKFNKLCKTLYDFVDQMPEECFALPALLNLIHSANQANLLESPFHFNNFEMWLNALGNITESDNIRIRSKIAGRKIPRDEYQTYFPITSGKSQWGSHIVTAHSSPDLDTAVASFWTWIDAFAARVGTGLHFWNLPGGRLSDHDARVFKQPFGSHLFDYLPKSRGMLTLQAVDLMSPHTLVKKESSAKASAIEGSDFEKGVILIDEEGYYKGDWRRTDAESVRQVTTLLSQILRFFEGRLHSELISLFAQPTLHQNSAKAAIEKLFESRLEQAEMFEDYTQTQKTFLQSYLQKILGVEQGYSAKLSEFAVQLSKNSLPKLEAFFSDLMSLVNSHELFGADGHLIEDRPRLLDHLEDLFQKLEASINSIREFSNTLDIALNIKHEVLNINDEPLSSKADVEEVRQRMRHFSYLTVVYYEKPGKAIPIGAIYAETLKRKALGTVSLRDFSNREEVKISDYLEVISVVDHHKSDLRCPNAPIVVISNTQSCNTLLAEMQMAINNRYSTNGQTLEAIQEQLSQLKAKKMLNLGERKQLARLLERESILLEKKDFFVHPEREAMEYMMYLYAILDDTDLLAKITPRDLRAVVQLVNRLETLKTGLDDTRLSIDDLEDQCDFLIKARERILTDKSMYNIYSQFYGFKENSIKEQLLLCQEGQPNTLFCDTKTQNGCARVGQIKLTSPLVLFFHERSDAIQQRWLADSKEVYHTSHEIDMHIQMVSTIAGAQDVFQGNKQAFTHQDSLWIWTPLEQRPLDHLVYFLRGLRYAKEVEKLEIHIEIQASNPLPIQSLIEQNFVFKTLNSKPSAMKEGALITMHFQAGSMNSRKAVISPYLPVQA